MSDRFAVELAVLTERTVSEIVLWCWCNAGPALPSADDRIHLWEFTYYLRLDAGYLQLHTPKGSGRLELAYVDDMSPPEQLADEVDGRGLLLRRLSLETLLFGREASGRRRCIGVRYLVDGAAVHAAEFEFEPGHLVFFDAWHSFGIRAGGLGGYEQVVADRAQRKDRRPYDERQWRPAWRADGTRR